MEVFSGSQPLTFQSCPYLLVAAWTVALTLSQLSNRRMADILARRGKPFWILNFQKLGQSPVALCNLKPKVWSNVSQGRQEALGRIWTLWGTCRFMALGQKPQGLQTHYSQEPLAVWDILQWTEPLLGTGSHPDTRWGPWLIWPLAINLIIL